MPFLPRQYNREFAIEIKKIVCFDFINGEMDLVRFSYIFEVHKQVVKNYLQKMQRQEKLCTKKLLETNQNFSLSLKFIFNFCNTYQN